MADQNAHEPARAPRKRTSTGASLTQSIASFTEDLVMNRDPAPGFFAATAQATSKAPTLAEIRRGSFKEEGWQATQHSPLSGTREGGWSGSGGGGRRRPGDGSWSGSSGGRRRESAKEGVAVEPFAPLTEEPTRMSEDGGAAAHGRRREEVEPVEEEVEEARSRREGAARHTQQPVDALQDAQPSPENHDPKQRQDAMQRAYSSGYVPPPKLPWTQSTAVALKAFWRWFITPFGFLVTLYGLNVVAWGGMLFLLLCNAAPAMCHAPVPTDYNRQRFPPAQALGLPGPYYRNCNDINSPRRIWLEIDSQVLNALFCVTGFGLVPWRFRDLYYILRYRFASAQKQGLEGKMYGLRVLAGIHRGWFRLPGSETLDTTSSAEYRRQVSKSMASATPNSLVDVESGVSSHDSEHDIRLPLPLAKTPSDPVTGIRAPPTKLWRMDFFIWCQVWNTLFQICLCVFMWGMDRYDRPSWSTGLFVALACIIAGVGGVVSFKEGRKVKRVEGVAPKAEDGAEGTGAGGTGLARERTGGTERESLHVGGEKKKAPGR